MAKPKITKLSDPSNPYGGKKTPTRERTPAEKLDAASRSRSQPERPAAKKSAPSGDRTESAYMRARRGVIDAKVDRADPPKGRKK